MFAFAALFLLCFANSVFSRVMEQFLDVEHEGQKPNSVCKEAVDPGPCDNFVVKWFYNKADGTCNRFHYGGCDGNGNRFDSGTECKSRCSHYVDVCELPTVIGPCSGRWEFYSFDKNMGHCVPFNYGGCLGNANRFATFAECHAQCGSVRSRPNAICEAAKDPGPCENFTVKWFYNKADGTCNRFHYGGCEGTVNRFDSEKECKSTCSLHVDICTLPSVSGPCSGKWKYYFYNKNTKHCEEFSYGGCLGNANRFPSIEACQGQCGDGKYELI